MVAHHLTFLVSKSIGTDQINVSETTIFGCVCASKSAPQENTKLFHSFLVMFFPGLYYTFLRVDDKTIASVACSNIFEHSVGSNIKERKHQKNEIWNSAPSYIHLILYRLLSFKLTFVLYLDFVSGCITLKLRKIWDDLSLFHCQNNQRCLDLFYLL